MPRINQREANAIREWWALVQRQAAVFIELIAGPPSKVENLNVTAKMVDLHDAQRAVQQISCPLEAEVIRGDILESMRMLQISLADLLANNPHESDRSYKSACDKYNRARDLMSRAGAL